MKCVIELEADNIQAIRSAICQAYISINMAELNNTYHEGIAKKLSSGMRPTGQMVLTP